MEEVRQLVQEEGREARNLVAFHVSVDSPSRVARKPPRALPAARRPAPRPAAGARLRSASAGRDKRSELRARYWALLFGDLQRAIGEIYNTVEAHENLNECQEVILVLENYTRDFKALGEWFRLKWEYDNTPPPQRPQSLAWEIRKTDFVRPESRRTYSIKSSPSVSGKNSPSLSGHNTPSGKNSPNLTGKSSPSGKISPRINSGHSSPKANIEFFNSKISTYKILEQPERESSPQYSKLTDVDEKDTKESRKQTEMNGMDFIEEKEEDKTCIAISIVALPINDPVQNVNSNMLVSKSPQPKALKKSNEIELCNQAKHTAAKLDEMEIEFLKKKVVASKVTEVDIELAQENATSSEQNEISNDLLYKNDSVCQLIEMENKFLAKQLLESYMKNDNMLNNDKVMDNIINDETNISLEDKFVDDKENNSIESPTKSEDNFADVSEESSLKSTEEKLVIEIDKNNSIVDINNISQNEALSHKYDFNETEPSEANKNDFEKISKNLSNKDIPNAINKDTAINEDNKNNNKDSQLLIENNRDDVKKDLEPKRIEIRSASESKPPRPAYSQAAAKPKSISMKSDSKPTSRSTTPLTRSKTIIEIKPNAASKTTKQFPKKSQTSKCSYPFNLTTGRTSLFDTSSKPVTQRRPITKSGLNGSGDAKPNSTKINIQKRPPRPMSLKIDEQEIKKEVVNTNLDKKDRDEYSSSDTIVTQVDMSRMESSESLKTLVPEDVQLAYDITNSIEVLNVDNSRNDNEGWLTVKSRRLSRESKKHSKSNWANRFHQPSATTSLPTLNMIESPKQEIKQIANSPTNTKIERAKSEQPQNYEKSEKIAATPKKELKIDDSAIIRQKSDVTGLKTRSARNKAISRRSEKAKDTRRYEENELTKNRLHSSLESLTMGLARSQENTDDTFDFDKWKAEFKTTFKYLEDDEQIPDHNELLKTADETEMSEIAEMTSQIEESEKKLGWALDFQSDVDQKKLCEEEDLLNRQIMELQEVSDIDIDTETDDTETDAEIICEDPTPGPSCSSPDTLSLTASLEDQYETALAGMSWAERMDTLVALEALVARDPGRAQQLHAKLSQGIKRRGSFQDALRRLQAKQARAERQRLEYQTERAKKIHQLLARVEEVKVAKNQLIEEKRLRMERRLQKAAENRDQHLKDIVRKAHDEEEKLREIAFIKQLEAENKRHDFLDQCRSHTTRLRQVRRDRLRKLEQKSAREAAVGLRRLALERARRLHVETLLERKKQRDARVDHMNQLRKQERDDAAREKAEGVKSRLSALAAAAQLEAVALRSRIRHKQDASQQRLESHLQAIREKATGPRPITTSESHDPSVGEIEEEAERIEQERREREKQKAIKKKARKVKQKLLATSNESIVYDDSAPTLLDVLMNPLSNKLSKVINQINNIITPLLAEVDDDTEKMNKKNKKNDIYIDNDNGEKKKKRKKQKTSESENNVINENGTEEIKTENNRRKKKKNKEYDNSNENGRQDSGGKAKLSKASSVCSSLSDMSKNSTKTDKRCRVVIDMVLLERLLSELHRILEKYDMAAPEKMMFQKLQGLKMLGQLLAVASEREELASQFSPKCLMTALYVWNLAAGSRRLALRAPVHFVALLRIQLDKDLQAEPKEMELTRHLSDCLSVALDSALCTTRIYAEMKSKSPEQTANLANIRARAHSLISYLCLSGCIAKAENAGEARESIQTLLTVCADLCHPFEADVGSERASATQSLRCALGTSLCGSRAEFCMLFAKGAGLEECGGFVRAARTAHLLKALAELDYQIVQDAFGEGAWPLEFRAAVARLLSQHAPNEKEAPRTIALRLSNQRLDQTLSENMVLDLIVLIGFVVVNNPQLQETICEGWSVIKTLCSLPANWLVSRSHSHALLPTLAALCGSPAAALIAAELSVQMLDDYMKSPEAQKVKLVQVMKQGRMKKNGKK